LKELVFKREVIDSILTYSKMNHPREGILLLRGKMAKDRLVVEEVMIPPFAIHDFHSSSFPLHALPGDPGVLGVFHSHPSGVVLPSTEDLNHAYGRIMVISGYPYESENDIKSFDKDGQELKFRIAD